LRLRARRGVMTRTTLQLKCSAAELALWKRVFGRGCVSQAARDLLNAAAIEEEGSAPAIAPAGAPSTAVELCPKFELPRAGCLCHRCKEWRGESAAVAVVRPDRVCPLTDYPVAKCLCPACDR